MTRATDKKGDLKGVKAPPLGRASFRGVKVVTIPLADYAALLDAKKRMDARDARAQMFPRSPIEQHPEVRDFILAKFGKMKHPELIAACKSTFGWAPSRSAVSRFFQRSRRS